MTETQTRPDQRTINGFQAIIDHFEARSFDRRFAADPQEELMSLAYKLVTDEHNNCPARAAIHYKWTPLHFAGLHFTYSKVIEYR